MKLNKIYPLLLALFVLGCQNPDEFLDVIPTGQVIPKTLDDIDGLLNSYEYARGRGENLAYMDPDVHMSSFTYGTFVNPFDQLAYQWNSELYNADGRDDDYIEAYKFIYISNYVLPLIDDAKTLSINPSQRNNLKAIAYAQRAMEFFLLVNEYAPHYDPAKPDTPGIALPTVTDLGAKLSRSSVSKVYELILSDLEKAKSLFSDTHPTVVTGAIKPGKASVYALLAEVNLYMGNFEKAKENSNIALSMYNFLYDYNTINFKNTSNKWLGYTNGDLEFSTKNKEIIWNRGHKFSASYNPVQLYHPDLEALFDKTSDRRWILKSTQTTNGGTSVAPNNIFIFGNCENNIGLSVPRLLLTNAEAKARTNEGPGAIASLNTLLAKRITGFTPLTHVNATTTLQTIKNERRKELHGTTLNIFDQKRYHVLGENVPTYTRLIPTTGTTITLAPGSKGYVVDIPLAVRNLNPNLN